jgi:hypothetical protein
MPLFFWLNATVIATRDNQPGRACPTTVVLAALATCHLFLSFIVCPSTIWAPKVLHEFILYMQVLEVGDKVELKVSKGDTIVYSKYGTTDIEAEGGKVVFVRSDSVLGVCA